MYRMKTLAERKVKSHEAMNYFLRVMCEVQPGQVDSAGLTNERALKRVQALYDGQGKGAELDAAKPPFSIRPSIFSTVAPMLETATT